MTELRPCSKEYTSDTIIVVAPTKGSLVSGHGSLESLNPEAERSVQGFNSNGEQSLATSDAECQDDIPSGGKEVLRTPEVEEELGTSHQESSTTEVEEEESRVSNPWMSN